MSGDFATRVRDRQPVCGTFIKTPQAHHAEIAGLVGLDFVVFDTEHAPFSIAQLDHCLLGAKAAGLSSVVRLSDSRAQTVLQALDLGASGVLVPHVTSAAQAREVVASARYRDGTRGFSNSPRAGAYGGSTMLEHLDRSDREAVVLCQIEDREAVDAIDEIARVKGIDCLFIGRADLAVSYRVFDLEHRDVEQAVERIASAGRAAGVPVGMFVGDENAVARYAALGITLFVIGSDQAIVRAGFTRLARSFAALAANTCPNTN
jgi:2-keto-3-deoxy-L-rhamnonate aldolase RhmA